MRDPTEQEPRVLFKYNRGGTGEDWSEKISPAAIRLDGSHSSPAPSARPIA
jgi:hypothetical protein